MIEKLARLPAEAQILVVVAGFIAAFALAFSLLALVTAPTKPGPTPPLNLEEGDDDWVETRADDYDLNLRERFALDFCRAIVQSGEPEDTIHNAVVAVRQANALIEALNDPKLRRKEPPV
jgi:hypothetical protein